MKRRTLLVGAGSLSVGSLSVIGSGAFSAVNANRDFSVRIAGDDDAYLRLDPIDTDFASYQNGSLQLTFDDDFSNAIGEGDVDSEDVGEGLGTDSVYTFDDVFLVQNQGTEDINVFGLFEDGDVDDIWIYDSADSEKDSLTESDPSDELEPGDSIDAGVGINTDGTSVKEDPYEETFLIGANATDSD